MGRASAPSDGAPYKSIRPRRATRQAARAVHPAGASAEALAGCRRLKYSSNSWRAVHLEPGLHRGRDRRGPAAVGALEEESDQPALDLVGGGAEMLRVSRAGRQLDGEVVAQNSMQAVSDSTARN